MSDLARLASGLADRYRIERELGHGGMATVYLAEDVRHHRQVALKVLHPELSATLGHERFLREVEISARLQHPHILTLIDSGESLDPTEPAGGRVLYYVMPFVDGESLRARIAREHQLPVADVVRIMREVADALSEAHARGVVHRDIKPDNVLLRGNHAIVTDFGIAKAVSEATGRHELTTVGVTLGTPTYMAPEQAAGGPDVDHRADIYALGVMAYEMLAGEPPFTGVTPQSVLAAHITQEPQPLVSRRATVPTPLAAVVMRCLQKAPADRWQSAAELIAQLDTVTTPGAGTLAPQPTSSIGARWFRSSRRSRLLALTVVGLTILGAAGYAMRTRGAPRASVDRSKPPTIVVLPFENLGAATDEYFADGMTDELMGRLARLPGLAVIARTSAMQYKKTTKPITQIAKELGADFLVEGTVRWEKTPNGTGRVRVQPQVIRASDGTRVWNDTFDKAYGTEIFSIQSEIAEHVAGSLDVSLRPGDERVVRQVPTTNIEAFDAYTRAVSALDRDFGQNWDAEQEAFEHLERAVRLDSSFAAAHARLAMLHWFAPSSGYDISRNTGLLPEQRWELARASAMRAIAADSSSALGHGMLAAYYGTVAGDTARQREEVALALRFQPSSPDAIAGRAALLVAAGRFEDGLREAERAKSLDPRNPRRWSHLAWFYRRQGDLAASGLAMERALAAAPNEIALHVDVVWNRLARGRREDARAAVQNAIAQAGVNAVIYNIAQSSVLVDIIRILPEDLGESTRRLTLSQFRSDTIDFYMAKIRGYYKDPVRVKAYYDSVVTWAQPRSRAATRAPYRVVYAWALAGSGRRADAARELDSILQEKFVEPENRIMLAEICVMIGRHDTAVAQLGQLIAQMNRSYTPAIVQLDPAWDPLRQRADFKKLVEGR
jgi:serine/threonine-protein kinase